MSRKHTSCMVQLSLNSGLDLNACLILAQKPTRQSQKLQTLRKYIKNYHSGWKKRLELADLYYEMGRWIEAIEEYQRVIRGQSQLLQPRLQLGKILALLNRTEQAIAVYQDAATVAKNQSTKQHIRGLIYSCQNNIQGAIAAFESATTLEPDNLAHWLALGQIQISAEHLAEALSTFERVLSFNPNNLMALTYLYDLLLGLDNLAEAEKCLQKLVEIAPQDIQTLKRLIADRCGKRLVSDAPGKQTKKLITSLLKQAPYSAQAGNLQAQYYILRGETAKGIKILEQFTQTYARNPQAWYYYARCLFDLGKHKAAATAILTADRLSNGDREIYRAAAEILSATGELDRARSIITEMLERFPYSWSLWTTAGKILVQYFQEYELGCSYSLHGTTLQPELAEVWLRHGKVLSLAGRDEEAIAVLNRGWKLLPDKNSNKALSVSVLLEECDRNYPC